jgi:hypothetical protein
MMPTELEELVTASLRACAGHDVETSSLLDRTRRQGARLRRRRRVAGMAGALAVSALVVVAVGWVPWPGQPDGATAPAAAPALPAVPDQPGALARPSAVGTDPHVVHFSADGLTADAEYVTWSAGRGTESVEVSGRSGRARVVLARDAATIDGLQQTLSSAGNPSPPQTVRIGDRPGTARYDGPGGGDGTALWFIRWQPTQGLWAQLDMYARSRDEALAAAAQVRFDRSRRCAVPFRLEALPAATRVVSCSVTLRAGAQPLMEGMLVVGDDAGRWLTVRAQHVPGRYPWSGDVAAGARMARWQGSDVLEMYVAPSMVEAFLRGWGSGYASADAVTVLSGYRPVGDLARPETW